MMNAVSLSTSQVVHVRGVSAHEIDNLVSQLHKSYSRLPAGHEPCRTVSTPLFGEVQIEAWQDMATVSVPSEQAEWVLFHSERCASMGGTMTMSGEGRDAFGRLDILRAVANHLSLLTGSPLNP